LIYGLSLIYFMNSWFEIDALIPFGSVLITVYLILSWLVSLYFTQFEFKHERIPKAISSNQ
jgi:alkylglycerol monooxygenase